LGCKDTKLTKAVGRKTLIAAVHRARVPGCKYDVITTLEGDEGEGKSTVPRIFAGDDFFSDQSILGARDKEVQENLRGVWMHEIADLSGMKKTDADHVKAFSSRQWDKARPAYGHTLEKVPRRGIEWATTNDDVYLQSYNGNRRFAPLVVGKIDLEGLRRDRLQLLGEAAHYESEGESVVIDEELWPDAKAEQEKRRVRHPWEDILSNIPDTINETFDFVSTPRRIVWHAAIAYREDGTAYERETVSSIDLLEHVLRLPRGQQQRHHSMQLASIMKLLKWQRPDGGQVPITGQRVKGYYRDIEVPLQEVFP
jgi:predicted P-loop ATPase